MRKYIRAIILSGVITTMLGMTSCEDYLDKSIESTVSSEEAFKNFNNFQGFTEELYYCIPDFSKHYWQSSFNWGEDELITVGANHFTGYMFDNGNFWGWQNEHDGWNAGWFDGGGVNETFNEDTHRKNLWPAAWYGIRKANLGLENLSKLKDATTEEKTLIEGQLYFFRGWFHFQLIQYFGGLPYINRVLPSDQPLNEPRLSYHQIADSIARDFQRAADLLPLHWDDTTVGKRTSGNNQQRINKIMALGYLGKNYLFAGSPLMNRESTGNSSYNAEYCKKAADAFADLLLLTESGEAPYALVDFEDYSTIFYTINAGMRVPGGTEAIFQSPPYDPGKTRWGMNHQYTPDILKEGSVIFSPTANYVSYYGMANGLPIEDITQADAESGYDPEYPWRNRDPRFYHDIVYDGVKCVQGTMPDAQENNRYANLFTGGSYRYDVGGSRTGYLNYKFIPNNVNQWDGGQNENHHMLLSYMRLADIYLMYAESAANSSYGLSGTPSGFNKTAVQAIDVVRERAGVSPVADKFKASVALFNSEVRRERAVELAFESHRFSDLRRWLLLIEKPYTLKTSHEFQRAEGFDPETPQDNRVVNLREEVILERDFYPKHYWLPLKTADVNMYPELYQNPGW